MKKMLQAKLVDLEKIKLENVPIPDLGKEEVLIEIKTCGICGSDIHAYRGEHPFVHPPIVLGHEFSGIICRLGSKANNLKEGDRVTVEPNIVCGNCYNCLNGRYNICCNLKVIGCVGYNGAFAEYIAVPKDKVIKLPNEVSFEDAALVEPTAVAIHTVRKSGQKIGDKILILGAGTIGLLVLQVAKLAGVEEVVITDLCDYRLKKAKEFGADKVLNPINEDIFSFIEKHYGNDGIDLIYDCVATEETIYQSIQIARKGTKIIITGVPKGSMNVNLAYVQDKELELIGTLMYTKKDFYVALEFIHRQRIQVNLLATHKFKLIEIEKAFQFLKEEREEFFKILIYPNEPEKGLKYN